jgi:hypothetical protein
VCWKPGQLDARLIWFLSDFDLFRGSGSSFNV